MRSKKSFNPVFATNCFFRISCIVNGLCHIYEFFVSIDICGTNFQAVIKNPRARNWTRGFALARPHLQPFERP